MLFYKAEGIFQKDSLTKEEFAELMQQSKISINSEEFNQDICPQSCHFIYNTNNFGVRAGIITDNKKDVQKNLQKFFSRLGFSVKDIHIREVTIANMQHMIRESYNNDFISELDEILEKYSLDRISSRRNNGFEFGENFIEIADETQIMSGLDKCFHSKELKNELDRIYAYKPTKHRGIPVHYVIETDDRDARRETYQTLLKALYNQKRIDSQRYCYMDFRINENFYSIMLDDIYKACTGGTVVIRIVAKGDLSEENNYARGERHTVETICSVVKQYQQQVQTILCIPRECKQIKSLFYECLGLMTFVEIKEEFLSFEEAKAVFKKLAKEHGVRVDKNLTSQLEEEKGYLIYDLHKIFEGWYLHKLKTTVYPQYKGMNIAHKEVAKAEPKGNAYDELQAMIGLTEAKAVIQKALNYYKMEKLYQQKGIKSESPAMHMVFTGNPGTAKTTVARLFARIMKDNGLISKGQLIEVGRGDLVGQYVGWTAQMVQEKFKKAKGGVLFIDEAYSLVDGHSGSFGDEAINTIVQEMENQRQDVVVIFAGYPDKMEDFLKKNPGMRSRIAFHVPFADYNPKELCNIANMIGKKQGVSFDEEAMEKLETLFASACKQSDFGNGRYVRNTIEQAKMNQASRLLEYDFDKITTKEITTIKASDIVIPEIKTTQKRTIGFAS